MKTKIIILFLFVLIWNFSKSQQLNTSSLSVFNRYLQNPAYAGSKPYFFVSASYSKYWSGINGSPEFQCLSAHSLMSDKMAFGVNLTNENTGLAGKSGAEFSYAYHLPISDGGTKLSFGLSALISQYKIFKDKLIIDDTSDEAILNSENNVIVPDAAFGLSLYNNNKYFIDLAVYQLLSSKASFLNNENIENRQVRHYFFRAGYQFTLSETFNIEPSVLFKTTEAMVNQIDVGLKAIIKKSLALGCFYRTNDAIVPFIGYDAKNAMFAYSYGIVMGQFKNYSIGTHEIMLVLKINQAKTSMNSTSSL